MSGVSSDVPGMLSKLMNRWQTVSALYLASVSACALATVYELPADGSAEVGTDRGSIMLHTVNLGASQK
jgi:hypothetical protein